MVETVGPNGHKSKSDCVTFLTVSENFFFFSIHTHSVVQKCQPCDEKDVFVVLYMQTVMGKNLHNLRAADERVLVTVINATGSPECDLRFLLMLLLNDIAGMFWPKYVK